MGSRYFRARFLARLVMLALTVVLLVYLAPRRSAAPLQDSQIVRPDAPGWPEPDYCSASQEGEDTREKRLVCNLWLIERACRLGDNASCDRLTWAKDAMDAFCDESKWR